MREAALRGKIVSKKRRDWPFSLQRRREGRCAVSAQVCSGRNNASALPVGEAFTRGREGCLLRGGTATCPRFSWSTLLLAPKLNRQRVPGRGSWVVRSTEYTPAGHLFRLRGTTLCSGSCPALASDMQQLVWCGYPTSAETHDADHVEATGLSMANHLEDFFFAFGLAQCHLVSNS